MSYFFGSGYKDTVEAVKRLWMLNASTAQKYSEKSVTHGRMSMKGIFGFVCALSIVTFGTAFFIALSGIFVSVLLVFFLGTCIWFLIFWSSDRVYLLRKRIFSACHNCKARSMIPTYVCGNCGAKHTNLTPGVYGITKRQCNCGKKLPSTAFNGRSKLDAECKTCGMSLGDRETVPICIPVVGGRSVGKTAFITAFAKDFIDLVAPLNGWGTAFYNEEKARIYDAIKADYESGSTRMTERPLDINRASSVSFSFFVKSPNFRPDRLVHIYDIAGEVFTDGDENEIQKQYEYCHGVVFVIDPFSIDSVLYRHESELAPVDRGAVGKADLTLVINTFLNKLRTVAGLSDKMMLDVPIAVVINKADSGSLSLEFSDEKIEELRGAHPGKDIKRQDALDRLCRQFLADNGMGGFLNVIDLKFKNNRYFACSAIGHARGAGAFAPTGVMTPMEWLFRQADSRMRRLWNDTEFSDDPRKIFK